MRNDPASPLGDKLFLVGLGAQKAGSSWITRYLRAHPEVFVPRLKELHYFDALYGNRGSQYAAKRLERIAKGISDKPARTNPNNVQNASKLKDIDDRLRMTRDGNYRYIDFFAERVTDERVFCDITPGYAILDAVGYNAILKTHPNVRFLFVMRDPVARFWSAMRMAMRNREDFDPDASFTELLNSDGVYLRTDYKRTILELEKVVPTDRIKYLFFEALFTQSTVDELTAFIGVRPWPADLATIVNAGQKATMKPEQFIAALTKFRHVYDFVFDRFGDAAPARWRTSVAHSL